MAETRNPSTPDLEWQAWNASSSLGVNVVNSTTVGVVNFAACEFWDVIEKSPNFTGGSVASNASSNATVTSTSPIASATYLPTGAGARLHCITWLGPALLLLLGGLITCL
jgi:hypothetical protein